MQGHGHSGFRVGLLAVDDPMDVASWSGIPAHMAAGLERSGATVVPLGPIKAGHVLRRRLIGLRNKTLPGRYAAGRDPAVLRAYGQAATSMVARAGVDMVLAPGSVPVSYLESAAPVVIWSDATVPAMVGYYEAFTGLTKRSLRVAERAEAAALAKCSLFVAASQWAAQSAIDAYSSQSQKVIVLPMGANIERPPEPFPRNAAHASDVRLLSVGACWHRKGFGTAVAAAEQLNASGIKATLDLVGATPPVGVQVPECVTVHGFLRKDEPLARRKLADLYRSAHLFVLPTQAECFGIVFCEAAAYGLPVVAPATGGIPTAVIDEETGRLVEAGAGPTAYAAVIRDLLGNKKKYLAMTVAARRRYERVLNWESACSSLLELAEDRGIVGSRRPDAVSARRLPGTGSADPRS